MLLGIALNLNLYFETYSQYSVFKRFIGICSDQKLGLEVKIKLIL